MGFSLKSAAKAIAGKAKSVGLSVKKNVVAAAKKASSTFTNAKSAVKSAAKAVSGKAKSVAQSTKKAVVNAARKASKSFSKAKTAIKSSAKSAAKAITSKTKSVSKAAKKRIIAAAKKASKKFRKVKAVAKSASKAAGKKIAGKGKALKDSMTAAARNFGLKSVNSAIVVCTKAVATLTVQTVGEMTNAAVSLGAIAAAETYDEVTAPYRYVMQSDSPKATPVDTLVVQHPNSHDIFRREYRMSLINTHFEGEGSPALRKAMFELSKSTPTNVNTHLQTIATERRRSLEQIKLEYARYTEYRMDVKDKIAQSNGKLEPLDELLPEQANFMGSTWQLRYGKVVGNRLGIDPVFGAMLNPTGGLVGPGAKGKAPDASYMPEAVAYHGAYHDAMGHLYNYHEVGPGYNYMESPIGLSPSNPFAGQSTGVAEWKVLLSLKNSI